MFITVYYGNQETLLCNPSCTIVNLLENIKERCGYSDREQVLDLTDETGLVLELDSHKNERATKYLSCKERYVLVEKKVASPGIEPGDDNVKQEVTYVPLLQRPSDNFPQYKARLALRGESQLLHSPTRGMTGRSRKGRKHKKSLQMSDKD